MAKKEEYIALEITGNSLDQLVNDLKEKILLEFWPQIPDSAEREVIKDRLGKSILSVLTDGAGGIS